MSRSFRVFIKHFPNVTQINSAINSAIVATEDLFWLLKCYIDPHRHIITQLETKLLFLYLKIPFR